MSAEAEVAGREPGTAARLKDRADFLRAAKGRKAHGGLFTLQSHASNSGTDSPARVGFTVTKKVGGAVERNRIRRRLREIVRITPDLGIVPSHDYVIVARRSVLTASFASLATGLKAALRKVNGPATPRVKSDVIRPAPISRSFQRSDE